MTITLFSSSFYSISFFFLIKSWFQVVLSTLPEAGFWFKAVSRSLRPEKLTRGQELLAARSQENAAGKGGAAVCCA